MGEVFDVRNVNGSSCSSRLLTLPLTVGVSVLMTGAPLSTTTCSASPPTAIFASMRTVWRASTLNGSVLNVPKPASLTSTLYRPWVRFWNSNDPVPSLVVVRSKLVCTSVKVTVAPGSTALLASTAVPTRAP